MIGWHYTSEACYRAILQHGAMEEYPLSQPNLRKILACDEGIYVFREPSEGVLDTIGSVVFQASAKQTFRVVELTVQYLDEDVKGQDVFLTHTGGLGVRKQGVDGQDWRYHDKVFDVLHGPIELDRVELVATYDLLDIVRHAKVTIA